MVTGTLERGGFIEPGMLEGSIGALGASGLTSEANLQQMPGRTEIPEQELSVEALVRQYQDAAREGRPPLAKIDNAIRQAHQRHIGWQSVQSTSFKRQ